MIRRLVGALLAAWLGGAACSESPTQPVPDPIYRDAILVGAGDIGWCGSTVPEATARLLEGFAGTVFTAGDNAQGDGSEYEFRSCYDPSWGRHKARTRPSPGNHDYMTAGAAPYYAYFGDNAGPPGLGYYSYELEAWHIIALNSELPAAMGSAQWAWLRDDLGRSKKACTLAYWHRPLYSVGLNGNNPQMLDVWRLLFEAGVEIVINGHDHFYERSTPQTPEGVPDPNRGIRQFIVGTGGAPLYALGPGHPNREAGAEVHGVLQFTLRPVGYTWQFVPVAGQTFVDTGSGACH